VELVLELVQVVLQFVFVLQLVVVQRLDLFVQQLFIKLLLLED
jgi:hypothetical protein